MTATVENLKSEISDFYIKDLKKQLGWFKSIAILPIQKPIKNILMGKGEMPEKFDEVREFGWRKDIINFVSPKVANEIFEFMKNKRLEIERRKTESELTELKNRILGLEQEKNPAQDEEQGTHTGTGTGMSDESEGNTDVGDRQGDNAEEGDSDSSEEKPQENPPQQENEDSGGTNGIAAGIETAAIGGAGTIALERIAARNASTTEQMMENLDVEKMKSTIESVIDITEKKKDVLRDRLTTKQLKTVDKYIEKLKTGIDGVDGEAVDVLKERNKLGNKFNIPRALLENCGLSTGDLSKISRMAKDLVGKSEDEIKTILRVQNITSVDDSIIKTLCKAGTPDELVAMTKILKHGNRVPRFLQTLAGALRVDAAFTGIDVWMYIEQKKEAELISKVNELRGKNKRKQAGRQLGIGLSSVAWEGIGILTLYVATGSAGGPIGAAIGIAVGAITMAASFGVDNLYFDVEDFYLQNQEDYLRQTRAQLKQAILQGIYNKKEGNGSQNERINSFFSPSMKPGSDLKEKSLNDACISMIFLEEIDEGGEFAYNQLLREYVQSGKAKEDFLSDKDQNYKNEFEQVWKEMESRVNVRMLYILDEFENSDIIDAINGGEGMQKLTNIFTNSRAYAEMKKTQKWDESKSFEDNLENYKAKLMSEFPADKVKKIEDLKQSNPSLFMEIISTVSLDAFIYGEEDDEKNEDSNYAENVKLVDAYKKRLELTQSVEDKKYLDINGIANSRFMEDLLKSDFDLSRTEYPSIESDRLTARVNLNCERYGLMDISDNPIQNVLYRLARELYGYSGENDMQGLMGFFSESQNNTHGIYYSNKRKINRDWAIDGKLKQLIPDDFDEEDIDGIVSNFMSKNGFGESSIDTPTESIDDKSNLEFKNKFKILLKEELSNRSTEKKEKIKNQILDFVKQHSNSGEYIELPYFLILDARRAGLGDLQRQFFKRENDKLEICYLPSEINQTSFLDNAEKSYITPARESFTEEEQHYINRVENAHKKIEALRNVPGINLTGESYEDDLDLPVEIEHLLSEKTNERKKFKQDMLLYNEDAVNNSSEKCKEYAIYFENLYKGILTSLMGFKVSNDIDSYSLFSQSLYYGNQNLFDESGNLLSIEGNKLLNDEKFREFYNEQINNLKIGSKTIKELWESDNSDDKELAKQASNAVYTTVLENCLINLDSSGKVTGISIGSSTYYEPDDITHRYGIGYGGMGYSENSRNVMEKRQFKKDSIIESLNTYFATIQNPTIDKDKIKGLLRPQEIKKLSQQERRSTETTPEIQKQIENTMKNIDWRYKRGKVEFDPESSTLKSRNNRTKVILPEDGSSETIHLDGLNLEFSMKEGLRLANFRNRFKFNYGAEKVEFGVDLLNKNFSMRKTLKVNGTMLLARGDFEKYCLICQSDDAMEKITERLNK